MDGCCCGRQRTEDGLSALEQLFLPLRLQVRGRCRAYARAGDVISSASATMALLDTTVATNDVTMAGFQAELPVVYSAALWNETDQIGQTAMLMVDNDTLLEAEDEGVYVWRPNRAGAHALRHTVNGITLVKNIHVIAPEVQIERLGDDF